MGTVDDGPAPTLSPPEKARPLWPGYTPPASSSGTDRPVEQHFQPVIGVRISVPVSRAEAQQLLVADPNVSSSFSAKVYGCTQQAHAGCPTLRPVAHRDLTGDGKAEAVVAVDDPSSDQTLLEVYRITGRSAVLPLLVIWEPLGATASTVGRELLVTSEDTSTRTTSVSRYEWNGDTLTVSNAAGSDRVEQPASEAP
ncbi:hypothetical protein [Streptomyces sp. 4F14]|uniref:hypothetical protein n=1 Tax=Streptomyces sp. 4F14 TaxID=3394380 RepID=UPI003A8A2384